MKIAGLIGGMSWESSLEYYRIMNQLIRERLGGQHSARILMFSVDFHPLEELMRQDRWEDITSELIDAARRLEKGGADFVVICTNTMHKSEPEIQKAVSIPLLHIGDAVGEDVVGSGLSTVGLLGTRYTMEQDFLKDHLKTKFGLDVKIPGPESRDIAHKVIFDELCLGKILETSKTEFERIIEELAAEGAQGIILGCTEIPLLIQSSDVSVPLFDTTGIHARKAVDWALNTD
jgi:aspartate racemase